jgi:hypothetical protein
MPAEAGIESTMIPAIHMAEVVEVDVKPEGRTKAAARSLGNIAYLSL